jgi:hypothetical protein
MITIVSHLHPSSKLLVVLQLQQMPLVIITARHQLLAITNKGRVIAKMAMVGISSLGMVSHHLTINSKVILLLLATAMWPTQLKKDMLLHMELKEIQLKGHLSHLQWGSKVILLASSLAQTQQVIHLRELLSLVMGCPHLPNLAMGVNQLHNMGAMEHLNHRNLQPIHLFMGRANSHPPPLEAMASLLDSQDIHTPSHFHLAMRNQIQVPRVLHHRVMVPQVLSQGMLLPMVSHQLVNQVMDRGLPPTAAPLMGVVTLSLLHILLTATQLTMVVGHMNQHQHHRPPNRVELLKHHLKVELCWRIPYWVSNGVHVIVL